MAETFDPYHKWLGIPPEDQPPDHYRLLSIKPFEQDLDVIAEAADRQMAHLRSHQTGPHAAMSQRLLNDVAAARLCLLSKEKKAKYDQQLRRRVPAKAPARKPPVVAHAAGPEAGRSSAQETGDWTGLQELGEYRLLEKLGAGGMGDVYKAIHTEMDRIVAVKVLPPGFVRDEKAVARFKREVRAVASLSHPNIVQAHDAREIEGTRFLVMEYVEGMDLRDVAKRLGPLPVADACELIRQAALGLQCAHEHGLVHRDIKPGNLMLTAGGQVKLLDLGLARPQAEEDDDEVTGTGEAMGTADYMAPEQAQDSRSVDIRADIYSLGCTLYRLIAGQPPFGGPKYNTAVKKLIGHVQDPVRPIHRFRADVPKRLEVILGRLLAKDPAKRLSTPAEVVDALGPLTVGADLPGLYSAATGQVPRDPSPGQAEVATQSSQSSGLTRFLGGLRGAASQPAAHPTSTTTQKKIPTWAGYAAIGAVMLLVILAWGVMTASRSPEKPPADTDNAVVKQPEPAKPKPAKPEPKVTTGRLVLQWPADQRIDAMLEINDQRRDVAELVSTGDPQALSVELKPGSYKVWIVRRGYEPVEQTVTVEAGKIATLAPQWKKLADVVVMPSPKPEEKPGPAKPEPKPPDVAVEKPKPKPEIEPEPPPPKVDPAIVAREQKWRSSVEPVEKAAAAWDFAGAAAALEKVSLEEPEFQTRLVRRSEELKRMAALKAKMITRIEAAQPRLTKRDLMLRGINGEVTGADDQRIHAKLANGKEVHAWGELNDKARPKLLQLAVDPSSADDWLAAGLMAFSAGDTALAEKLLNKAHSLGRDIDPYLVSLASAALAQAQGFLEAEKWTEAENVLSRLQEKYGNTPWFQDRKEFVGAMMAKAKRNAYEAAAEKVYAEAAKLFEKEEFFDLKPLVEKLKGEFADSTFVTDANRQPSFSEMENAAAHLGERIIVRLDGKGDFKGIQAAIDAAPANTLIEILDNGPYQERLSIPVGKAGLTIRGNRACWPVVVHAEKGKGRPALSINGSNTALEHLILLGGGGETQVLASGGNSLALRSCAIAPVKSTSGTYGAVSSHGTNTVVSFEDCLILANMRVSQARLRNCCCLVSEFSISSGAVHRCTITCSQDNLRTVSVEESIMSVLTLDKDRRPRVTSSNIIGGPVPPGATGCFGGDPQFHDPASLDYRLGPASPCKGKASDGGDIGCRYTPEMIEMCKIALELRARGIIKF